MSNAKQTLVLASRILLFFYRVFAKRLMGMILLRVQTRDLSQQISFQSQDHFKYPNSTFRRIWLHAASVGELESLWCVAHQLAAQERVQLILSVFSQSAAGALEKLKSEIVATYGKNKVIVSGYSPLEGEWGVVLKALNPQVFVTVKYEAWPDLWISLSINQIPLVIVGAMERRSLIWIRRILHFLGVALPRIDFLTVQEKDVPLLKDSFPGAKVITMGEPRWERVLSRFSAGQSRLQYLLKRLHLAPRPWGVLGSVWPEDLRWIGEVLRSYQGTLWIVPHRCDPESLNQIFDELDSCQLRYIRTSLVTEISEKTVPLGILLEIGEHEDCHILVDEMGFLTELYSHVDWAYVGGGFGRGVHSTLEPAIHGIPIAAGPHRASHFPEISELQNIKQLSLIQSAQEFREWMDSLMEKNKLKASWKQVHLEKVQVVRNIANEILEHIPELSPNQTHVNL